MADLYDHWDAKKKGPIEAPPGPGAEPAGTRTSGGASTSATTAYGRRALDSELATLALAPEGSRNATLNEAAFSLYQLVFAGHLDEQVMREDVSAVARRIGLTTLEIINTMGSARSAAQVKGRRDVPSPATPGGAEVEWDLPITLAPAWERVVDFDTTVDEPEAGVEQLASSILRPIDWHELWADEREEEWIIEPLLSTGRLVAIYSEPKVGKSLICLEIAAGVSCGRDVLGDKPDRPYKVLYVDFENDPRADIRPRLQAMGYGPGDLGNLHYLSFPALAALDSVQGGIELMAAIERYGAEVVVVDTISRAVRGKENENDTWLDFYKYTGLLLKRAGVALIRLDHAGKDAEKGQRGGSAKGGDVDLVWRLSKVTETTYRLDNQMKRMPLSPEMMTLTIHRRQAPLRHEVDALGWRASAEAKRDLIITILNEAGMPLSSDSRREARKHIKAYQNDHPEFTGVRNETLARILSYRAIGSGAHDLENDPVPEGSGHGREDES